MLKIHKPQLSVVICTYNRFTLLQKAIESLVNQTANKRTYEIIIIDNGNNSKIKRIVLDYKKKYLFPKIRYFHQVKTGLSFSRNLGIRKGLGNYVGFLDDDAKADSRWVDVALAIFQKKMFASIVGGPIYPIYQGKKPVWFKDEYETRSWGKRERNLSRYETFSGSNIFIKKEIFTKFGLFDERFGMSGKNLNLGEETSFFLKIWQNTSKNNLFYYSPELLVYHHVNKVKMTISYPIKRSFIAGQARYIKNQSSNIITAVYSFTVTSIYLIYHLILSILTIWQYKYYQRFLLERGQQISFAVGCLLAVLGIHINVRQR